MQTEEERIDDLSKDSLTPAEEKAPRYGKKKLVMLGSLFALLLMVGMGSYLWLGEKEVRIKTAPRPADKVTSGSDLQKAAFDSLSASLHGAPSGTPSAIPPLNQALEKAAMAGAANPALEPSADMAASLERDRKSSEPSAMQFEIASNARTEKPHTNASITFSAGASRPAAFSLPTQQAPVEAVPEKPILIRTKPQPDFGAMLPVRLMGSLYTLRPGAMARLELARDLQSGNWSLKRGTVFVGAVLGAELDRAFIQIKGYIDPETHRFIKLEGETLGSDGGAGLRGKRRRIASAWTRVLDRATQSGTQILTGVLGRQNSAVIVATDPYGAYRDPSQSQDNRSFVEVAAGAVGFILVTALPEADKSEANLAQADAPEVPDEKMAALLAEANPTEIRAALPQMNPELRRIAELVLKELEGRQ